MSSTGPRFPGIAPAIFARVPWLFDVPNASTLTVKVSYDETGLVRQLFFGVDPPQAGTGVDADVGDELCPGRDVGRRSGRHRGADRRGRCSRRYALSRRSALILQDFRKADR